MLSHIINKYSKLVLDKYKTRHDWVSKVIYRELCKKFKFDHMIKWYVYNPESLVENEMHKLLWDFEIQTDSLISSKQSVLIIINKKRKKKKKKEKNENL